MSEYIKINETVYFTVNFYNPNGGYSTVSQITPQWQVYKNTTLVPILSGAMLTRGGGSVGSYVGSFVASLANGFNKGEFYDVQAVGRINNRPAYFSMKQFVLDDVVDANIVQVSGVPASSIDVVKANIVQVSGVRVSLADFNLPAGGSVPTAAAVADAVWDEAVLGHQTQGSTGYALNVASGNLIGGAGTAPTAAVVAGAVWTELTTNHVV